MSARKTVETSLLAISLLLPQVVQCALHDFTIAGNYEQTLLGPEGATILSAGDAFTIAGYFDTAAQPVVDTASGSEVVPDEGPIFGSFSDHRQVVLTSFDIPIAEINQAYPSADVFGPDEYMNGVFMTHAVLANPFNPADNVESHVLSFYLDYSFLTLSTSTSAGGTVMDGSLSYHFHEVNTGSEAFPIIGLENETLALSVSSFTISGAVPVPPSMLLMSGAMLTVLGFARRRVRSQKAVAEKGPYS